MADWTTIAIPIFTLLGVFLGAYLSDHLRRKEKIEENQQKVAGLRKLLYVDIITIYTELSSLHSEITIGPNSEVGDPKTAFRILETYQRGLKEIQRTHWYRNAREHPFEFMQLSDGERMAMAEIALLQGTQVAISGIKYLALQETVERDEKEPRILLKVLGQDLESVISKIKQEMKDGLDREFLFHVCPDADKHFIRLTIGEEHKTGSDEQENKKKPKKKRLLQRIRS